MRGSKVVAACIFNELQAVSLFLAFDGASTRTDHFTSGKKYRKSVNIAVFIRNESLFFVSAAATSAFQLEHTTRLLRSACPGGYRIRTIEYGKILVMLVYGEYYGRVYEEYLYCMPHVRISINFEPTMHITVSKCSTCFWDNWPCATKCEEGKAYV